MLILISLFLFLITVILAVIGLMFPSKISKTTDTFLVIMASCCLLGGLIIQAFVHFTS